MDWWLLKPPLADYKILKQKFKFRNV